MEKYYIPRSGIAGSYSSLCLTKYDIAKLFSKVITSFFTLKTMYKCPNGTSNLPKLGIVRGLFFLVVVLYTPHGYVVISHYGFNFQND